MQHKFVSASDSDIAVVKFITAFCASDLRKRHLEFEDFKKSKYCLDEFWIGKIDIQKY